MKTTCCYMFELLNNGLYSLYQLQGSNISCSFLPLPLPQVLVAAAKELSKPSPPSTQAAHRKVEEIQPSSQADSATWREIVEKRIESKTRRFARGRSQPLPQPMPNMFAPVAGHFFYPLMKNFDRYGLCVIFRLHFLSQRKTNILEKYVYLDMINTLL